MKISSLLLTTLLLSLHSPLFASSDQILITNIKIFDGHSDTLSAPSNVLINGNKIMKISTTDIKATDNTQIIDGKNHVMTPGFIDIHAHVMLQESFGTFLQRDSFYIAYIASREAKRFLMHGFTTIRDLAGIPFHSKKR